MLEAYGPIIYTETQKHLLPKATQQYAVGVSATDSIAVSYLAIKNNLSPTCAVCQL